MTKPKSITEDQLDLMYHIQNRSNVSQRLIAQKTGFSIGKVNYCLRGLLDIGFIKVHNLNNPNQKINYSYILIPKGIREKKALAKKFLIKKKQEYDKLNSYINK